MIAVANALVKDKSSKQLTKEVEKDIEDAFTHFENILLAFYRVPSADRGSVSWVEFFTEYLINAKCDRVKALFKSSFIPFTKNQSLDEETFMQIMTPLFTDSAKHALVDPE